MGCCSSSPDRFLDGQVQSELKAASIDYNKRHKLLFLGSGGSGKSTFFKQLRCIHGTGFSHKDRKVYKEHISAQIVEQMKRSVECIPFHNERLPDDCDAIALTDEGTPSHHIYRHKLSLYLSISICLLLSLSLYLCRSLCVSVTLCFCTLLYTLCSMHFALCTLWWIQRSAERPRELESWSETMGETVCQSVCVHLQCGFESDSVRLSVDEYIG